MLEMKRSYISAFATNSDRYERYGSYNKLAKLVELEFVHENLHNLRCSFSKAFQKTLQHLNSCCYFLGRDIFMNIFSWCFKNDNEALIEFKRTVSVEDIFNAIFHDAAHECYEYSHRSLLRKLDVFLMWYFSGVTADVIKFKSEMKNDSKVKERLNYAASADRPFQEILLEWFPKSVEAAAETRSPTSPVLTPTKKKAHRFGLKKIKQWFSKSTTNL